ncbi:hypothetical protein GR204_34370 [Rhizobium leguminosarum]|uniref:Uncharacterized protein n=1 Tax=Rhizobium leguminosarum TaxID=384 RepID=A0A6P0BG95_RHILE|nr:hypothetical protein [Rhizobium leguminosarum]NEI38960.1 hypothetical protein [Rhizobium leguminosarum]NEI45690.1 hypothetical protein [Rhizobium leguminosarum]
MKNPTKLGQLAVRRLELRETRHQLVMLSYRNALDVTRRAFVQDRFSTGQKPETGIVVMNMYKAKGKQFDEVIVFERWPVVVRKKLVANPDRIVPTNQSAVVSSQHRQYFRVSATRHNCGTLSRGITAVAFPESRRLPCHVTEIRLARR